LVRFNDVNYGPTILDCSRTLYRLRPHISDDTKAIIRGIDRGGGGGEEADYHKPKEKNTVSKISKTLSKVCILTLAA